MPYGLGLVLLNFAKARDRVFFVLPNFQKFMELRKKLRFMFLMPYLKS